ncbi:MAG: hypothetical protein GWN18_00575, partial [Thermoplasmata archaeon]|nr:hypothetical protein [Thermoplasmata archaeon]NIS10489.1 hypothetical protein [Thermoplasmata archaeon]NIS18450.1 hypothetical protein [Thermoplasmata archaeon]NIT75439.1 hypothetical protein [Thermoplasmata archaeon]NIV77263.1 hypothetical protein [Thermoplasmata archaeon]
ASTTKNGTEIWPVDLVGTEDGQIYYSDWRHQGVMHLWQNITIVQVDQKAFNDTDG